MSRWWEPPVCADDSNPTNTKRKSLAISGIAGVFIVLTGGILLALLAAVMDYIRSAGLRRSKNPSSSVSLFFLFIKMWSSVTQLSKGFGLVIRRSPVQFWAGAVSIGG